ncbi:unnamed protein product [Vicia faba]|nr:unnamed protein product [Vicia faba]
MGGRGLCKGEEGLQKELKREIGSDDQNQPPSSEAASNNSTQSFESVAEASNNSTQSFESVAEASNSTQSFESVAEASNNSTQSFESVAEDGFEKELMGLTGGFPGGEKGLRKFIEENPVPKPDADDKRLKLSSSEKAKPPELPMLLPGMIAIVKNQNNPFYMYCGIVQRITDGKAGVLFEGGNWDKLITFRLDELERREKGPPMKNPKSCVLEPFLVKKT